MVLARRLNERRLADARKEGEEVGEKRADKARHKRWQAWYDNLPDEVKNQQPPPPPPPEEE